MYFSTALIVKNSPLLVEILFILLESVVDPTWKDFNTKFGPQWKDQESI